MKISNIFNIFALISFIIALANPSQATQSNDNTNELKTYIVQLNPAESIGLSSNDITEWHKSFFSQSKINSDEGSRLIHSYTEVFSGFAAKLTEDEVKQLATKRGFVRAIPSSSYSFQTTHSPSFLGLNLNRGLWNASSLGKGIIIAVLDTGITPNHPSFDDKGIPPPPSKWKGKCMLKKGCNNKLIGAVNMFNTSLPPVDIEGHGTHTTSTAAGNFAQNASFYGMANGTASGIAPLAHIAVYKVCEPEPVSCTFEAILAGMDAAVKDGADILSISLGLNSSIPFFDDPLAIAGFYAAAKKGVVVVAAAGNSGPDATTIINDSPWMLTVAASSTDRSFRATIKLGNNEKFFAESVDLPWNFSKVSAPLYYRRNISCDIGLRSVDIKGKIVVCDPLTVSQLSDAIVLAKQGDAAAIVRLRPDTIGHSIMIDRYGFFVASVTYWTGQRIIQYATTNDKPTISVISNGTVFGASPAPVVAFFSSRGPSGQAPNILKPDISAPGLNILAAWPFAIGDFEAGKSFNLISGTSMATPHISGVVALIKSQHPDWSPAAIKSAIMTTANYKGNDGQPIKDHMYMNASFFDMGAGHVNPSKANDPGLVYDLNADDYIKFICELYGNSAAKIIAGNSTDCSIVDKIFQSELNYPSIGLTLKSEAKHVRRIVTNVGPANSIYDVKLHVPDSLRVTVSPKQLKFSSINEKKKFKVNVRLNDRNVSGVIEGSLSWVSDQHVVRSPIVVIVSKII